MKFQHLHHKVVHLSLHVFKFPYENYLLREAVQVESSQSEAVPTPTYLDSVAAET